MASDRERRAGGTAGEPPPRHALSFEMADWQAMSSAMRVQYCHLMAEEGLSLARNAPDELKEGYLELAANWLELATEIERIRRSPRP
jgi:hypothetical protein